MLTWIKRIVAGGAIATAIGFTGMVGTSVAYAAEEAKPAVTAPAAAATPAAPAATAAPAPTPNKGDTAWMMVSTALVLLMTVPGLAL
ncbi:MAG: ammonia channel protein, partial [Burkholderiaceae bacterium]|nr:ammonia channel protein [Burkholderiaceae bacterium]